MQPVDAVIVLVTLMILFISLTAVYGFIAGVPFVPTGRSMVRSMIDLARLSGSENVFDVGAGDGKILIATKRRHPAVTATGIELSPTVWLLGKFKILLSGQRITFLRRNAFDCDLRNADTIFLYLWPDLMVALEDKFDRELKPGTVVISHAFRFPRRQPTEVIKLQRWSGKKTLLRYEW